MQTNDLTLDNVQQRMPSDASDTAFSCSRTLCQTPSSLPETLPRYSSTQISLVEEDPISLISMDIIRERCKVTMNALNKNYHRAPRDSTYR
jgi:hypothetical protein